MSKFTALFLLPRPLNGLITALSVGVGALTTTTDTTWPMLWPTLLAALSAALINGAGNAFNDLIDIDIDRINRPDRPLPAGHLSPLAAGIETLILTFAGSLCGFWLSPEHGMMAIGVALLLAIYSIFLKNSLLWGNILVASIGGIAFFYGALAVGEIGRSWIPALFAFLFHIGREIVKDIEDVAGDRIRGEHTLPLRWGAKNAALSASFVYVLLIGLTWYPFFAAIYNAFYALALLPVNGLVLYVLWQLHRQGAMLSDDRLGRLLKIGMFSGLLAIVIGELAFDLN